MKKHTTKRTKRLPTNKAVADAKADAAALNRRGASRKIDSQSAVAAPKDEKACDNGPPMIVSNESTQGRNVVSDGNLVSTQSTNVAYVDRSLGDEERTSLFGSLPTVSLPLLSNDIPSPMSLLDDEETPMLLDDDNMNLSEIMHPNASSSTAPHAGSTLMGSSNWMSHNEKTPGPPPFVRSTAQVVRFASAVHQSGFCPPPLPPSPRPNRIMYDPVYPPPCLLYDTAGNATRLGSMDSLPSSTSNKDSPNVETSSTESNMTLSGPDPCVGASNVGTQSNDFKKRMASSSTVSKVDVEQAMATAATLDIPASLVTGKFISTEYGIAMLVVPNKNITPAAYAALSTIAATATHSPVVPSTSSEITKCKHWTKPEDDLLKYAIEKNGPEPYNWTEIARTYFVGIRSPYQCKNRWKKIKPTWSTGPFSSHEDEIILSGKTNGLSWTDIAVNLPGRSTDSIRGRFINVLDPTLVKNVAWTAEEERILHTEQQKLGNKWSQIAKLLPGRSENDVKNHWHNAKIKASRKMKSLAAVKKRAVTLSNLRKPKAP